MPWLVTTGASLVSVCAFVALFVALSLALGRRILGWLGAASEAAPLEIAVLAAGLGIGTLQFVPFFLGVFGPLSVTSIRVVIGLVALVTLADLWAVVTRIRETGRAVFPGGWLRAWIAVTVPGLAVTLLVALTPTLDPDGLGYHLTVPKRWLELGSIGYLDTYAYSNTPMGVEMLFMIAMAFVGDAGAKSLHFAMGLLGAVGVYLAGKRLSSTGVGVAAASLYLFGPAGVAGLMGLAYVEGASSFATIASTLAWLVWYDSRKSGWLRAAALLAGIGVSFKITAALFPIGLGALTALSLWDEAKRRGTASVRDLLPVLGLAPFLAAPLVPWFVRSALLTGNPFFPLFARWIPSRDLTPEMAKRFEDYNRYMLWASRFGSDWTLEQRRLILLVIGVVLVIAVLLVRRRLESFMARSAALVVLAVVLVQISAAGLYMRYWIPALAVLQLPALMLFRRFLDASAARSAIVVVTALLSLFHVRQSVKGLRGPAAGLLLTPLGVEAQRSFLLVNIPIYPLYEHANQRLPADARIMLSTYCGAFYIDRMTYCAEFASDSLRFTSWADFVADIRRLRVTHVIAPTRLANGDTSTGKDGGSVAAMFRANQNDFVGRLLQGRGRELAIAADQGLYAVDLTGLR